MSTRRLRWAIIFLVVFTAIALLLAYLTAQSGGEIEDSLWSFSRLKSGCAEVVYGDINLKQTVTEGQVAVSLEYDTDNQMQEQAAKVDDSSYSILVRGVPTANTPWTVRAFYYDKNGQISETAEELSQIGCDQRIRVDVAL